MSLIDKAKKFINDNPDKVRQGIDKIGDATPNTEPDTPGTDAPKTDPNA